MATELQDSQTEPVDVIDLLCVAMKAAYGVAHAQGYFQALKECGRMPLPKDRVESMCKKCATHQGWGIQEEVIECLLEVLQYGKQNPVSKKMRFHNRLISGLLLRSLKSKEYICWDRRKSKTPKYLESRERESLRLQYLLKEIFEHENCILGNDRTQPSPSPKMNAACVS